MDMIKFILDIVVIITILIVFAYILLRFIPKLRNKCGEPTNHTFSAFENLVTLVITISFGMLGYNIYNAYDIRETKQELENIRLEYKKISEQQSSEHQENLKRQNIEYQNLVSSLMEKYNTSFQSLENLKKISSLDFLYGEFGDSERLDYQLINEDIKREIEENLNMFSSIFIASAILTTEINGSLEAIDAWYQAMQTNPKLDVAKYGYALENFKYALTIPKEGKEYTLESLKYFEKAYENFLDLGKNNIGQANYYIGVVGHILLDNINRCKDFTGKENTLRAKKYEMARKSIDALIRVQSDVHNLGAIDYNLYLNYYALAKNTCSTKEYENYKELANQHFNKIKSLEEYKEIDLWSMPQHECINK